MGVQTARQSNQSNPFIQTTCPVVADSHSSCGDFVVSEKSHRSADATNAKCFVEVTQPHYEGRVEAAGDLLRWPERHQAGCTRRRQMDRTRKANREDHEATLQYRTKKRGTGRSRTDRRKADTIAGESCPIG